MESEIVYNQAGDAVMMAGDAVLMFRAFTLASSLKLYAATGIIPTRGCGITHMLKLATSITKKTYKRGEALKAADDVTTWARELKAALPTSTR